MIEGVKLTVFKWFALSILKKKLEEYKMEGFIQFSKCLKSTHFPVYLFLLYIHGVYG